MFSLYFLCSAADSCAPHWCPFMLWSWEVCECFGSFTVNNATLGIATHQCLVKDWPHWELWKFRYYVFHVPIIWEFITACDIWCLDHLSIDYSSSWFAAFNLDFYTDVQDLSYLQHHLEQDPRSAKYRWILEHKTPNCCASAKSTYTLVSTESLTW